MEPKILITKPSADYELIDSGNGEKLERFLCTPVSLALLDGSVDFRKPAAQTIARPLLETFGERARDFRFRQLVGHMIRHLMEERGYVLDQMDVRIRDGVLFTRAARYRRVPRVLTAGRTKMAS